MVIPEQLLGCQWELKTLGNNKNNLVWSETHQNASGLFTNFFIKSKADQNEILRTLVPGGEQRFRAKCKSTLKLT